MQIIQSIRKRAAIATAAIAIAIIGFILLDAKNGSGRLFSGSSNSIGKVNGEDIDFNDFMTRVKETESQYGSQASGQTYQIRQNVWDQVVAQAVLNSEFDKLGITLSPKELSSILFSENAPSSWKQLFTDKNTGQYDILKAEQGWGQIKKAKGEERENIESEIIDPIVLQTLAGKYSGLIAAGLYYPTWMQNEDNIDSKSFSNISYVSVPYSVISDSAVKVSDDDIVDYLGKHKATYKQEAGRLLSYVTFSTNPSTDDTAKTLQSIADLKLSFAADTNAKIFLARNSSAIPFDDHFVLRSKFSSPKKDSIMTLPINGVFGPYLDNKNFVLAKLVATRQVPDSVKCRHILIKIADNQKGQIRPDSVARKLIDSIAAAIKGGADFNEMVLKYSDDEGSKNTKGEYKFSSSSQLVDSFYRTVFYDPIGTKKIVKGESGGQNAYIGYHYIEVLDQWKQEQAYKVAYQAKEILSSDETINIAESKATKLSGEARDAKAFDAYVSKNGLRKVDFPNIVKENDFQIGELRDTRQVIKWAFGAKEGDVSEPMSIGDQFVVAVVDKIEPEGLPDAATARPQVENLIRNQKKGQQITAKLGTTPTLESASSLYKIPVQTAGADSSLTFSSLIISGVGQEPKIIGSAFNKNYQSKASSPIAGNSGVYVIKVNNIGNKPADSPEQEAQKAGDKEKTMLQQLGFSWFEPLKKNAEIKDNRSKFF